MKISLILLLASLPAAATANLFATDGTLEVTLSGPLATLASDKRSTDELPFTLTVDGHTHSLAVRARGKSRRAVCSDPPLRLAFPDDGPEGSPFTGQDRLKLVRPCTRGGAAEDDVLEEYAAYRLFNVLSDKSLRVRLLRVTYVDTTNNRNRSLTRWSFVIEPPSALAQRMGGERLRIPGVALGRLDTNQAGKVFVFQYLIGNADWSLATPRGRERCCHNMELIGINSMLHPVPYDFDMTALVKPRYVQTHPSLSARNVNRRRYRGYCIDEGAVEGAIVSTLNRRDDLLGVVRDLPGLDDKVKQGRLQFLEKYFAAADNRRKLMRTFRGQCLGG